MIVLDSQTTTIEAIGKLFAADVDMCANVLRFKKKRTVKVQKSPDILVSLSLELSASFKLISDGRRAVNEAEVFLLAEEIPVLTQALVQHPILFPISYSQQLFMKHGMYCIRLTSQEPPEDFAERLSEALCMLA